MSDTYPTQSSGKLPPHKRTLGSTGLSLGMLGAGVLLLLSFIFASQNSQKITTKFFFWEFQLAQFLLIVLMLLVGMVIGYVFGLRRAKR